MKKQIFFGLFIAILAVGLVFTGCDLLAAGGTTPDTDTSETYEPLVISGRDIDGKEVSIEISRTTSKAVLTPKSDDNYKITWGYDVVSSGKISVSGTNVTFRPLPSGNSFDGTLYTATSLSFPKGIPTATGTIMGYKDKEDSNPRIDPVFADGGNLSTSQLTMTAGQSLSLEVTMQTSGGGGTAYYQWYKGSQNSSTGMTPIFGATNASYTVSAATTSASGFYCVKVGNTSGGVVTSNIREVKVNPNETDISREIIVGEGTGKTPLYDLKKTITTLLGSNLALDYTVNFAMDLPYPLFVSKDDFPGTGKLTIKSSVKLTKGIYITRSDVELNGLDIKITDPANAALYYGDENKHPPCAVLISDRYFRGVNYPAAESYAEYKAYLAKDIKRVSVVDCNIVFEASHTGAITGICVDPYTAGRNPSTRAKITNTVVDVERTNSGNAQCFMGNNTDLTGNTFISSDKVAYIPFILKLTYGDTITFANNRFTSTAEKVFEVHANSAGLNATYKSACESDMGQISADCKSFGEKDTNGNAINKFGDLPSKYRWFIENLFAQLIDPAGKAVLLIDYFSGDSDVKNEYYTRQSDGTTKTEVLANP